MIILPDTLSIRSVRLALDLNPIDCKSSFDSVIVKLRSRSGKGQVNFGKVQVRLSLELNSKLKTET